jgi:hypothetical protein
MEGTSPTVMVVPLGAINTVLPSALSPMLCASVAAAVILPFMAPVLASMMYQKFLRLEPATMVKPSGVISCRSQHIPS